jgi:hypothetical protein
MERLSPKSFSTIIDSIEYQKAYLFRILLPEVDLIDSSGNRGATKLKPFEKFELCTSATALPGLQTDVQPIPYYNGELKIATKTKYGNWGATFRLDINKQAAGHGLGPITKVSSPLLSYFFGINANIPLDATSTYQYFYNWARVVYNIKTRVSYLPIVYKQPIDLFLLNEQGQDILNFTLYGAFPVNISGGNLDYANDGLLTYNVDFAFDSFELKDVGTSQYVSASTAADQRATQLKAIENIKNSTVEIVKEGIEGVKNELEAIATIFK